MNDDIKTASTLHEVTRAIAAAIEAEVPARNLEVSATRTEATVHGEVRDEETWRRVQDAIDAHRGGFLIRNRVTLGWTGPSSSDAEWNRAMTEGDFVKAVRRAGEIDDPACMVAALCWFGRRLDSAGRESQAEAALRRAVEVADTIHGEESVRCRTEARLRLAASLRGSMRYAEAVAWCREALAIREAADGPWDPRVAAITSELASFLNEGQMEDASWGAEVEPLYRRTVEILERAGKTEDPIWCDSWLALANILERAGRADEAAAARARAAE